MSLSYLIRGVRAEALKVKRSLALIAALVIPLFPAVVNLAGALRRGLAGDAEELAALGPWGLYVRYAIKFWVIFALPMVIALLAALLAQVDHKPKQWKQLFALAYPRSALYAAKWLALAGVTLLSTLVFAGANIVGGMIVAALRPDLGLELPLPLGEVVGKPLLAWALALAAISIHHWIALRWPSFLSSLAVGFAASVANLFLISSYLYERAAFFPWAMPSQAYGAWQGTLRASLIAAALVYALARAEFVRRDVY